MVGTALTVWAAFINFGSREINIVAALSLASTKGFSGGRILHAPHFRKENDLLGSRLHRFLCGGADDSDLAFHEPRWYSTYAVNRSSMSLKAFHVVFVTCAVLLAFFFGGGCSRNTAPAASRGSCSAPSPPSWAGGGMIWYGRAVLRKLKHIGYL